MSMKPLACLMFVLLPIATGLAVPPGDAPAITAKIKLLDKRVEDDGNAAILTTDDLDNFSGRISRVRNAVANAKSLDAETREKLRLDLNQIEKDIADKEAAAKSGSSPLPLGQLGTPSPAARSGASSKDALAEAAPALTAKINALEKRIANDMVAGKLSKEDGAQFNARLVHVQDKGNAELPLTATTRQALRDDVTAIAADLAAKDGGPKSGPSPSPNPLGSSQ